MESSLQGLSDVTRCGRSGLRYNRFEGDGSLPDLAGLKPVKNAYYAIILAQTS